MKRGGARATGARATGAGATGVAHIQSPATPRLLCRDGGGRRRRRRCGGGGERISPGALRLVYSTSILGTPDSVPTRIGRWNP
jgi:hypothetical protein